MHSPHELMMQKYNGYPPMCWDCPGGVYKDNVRISYLSATGQLLRCCSPSEAQLIAVAAGHIPYFEPSGRAAVDD